MERPWNWITTIQKLSNVKRYSQASLVKQENVLEHSATVALIGLHIAHSLAADGFKYINSGEIVTKALLHDIEESEIGDIASPAKYHTKEISKAIKEMEEGIADKIFDAAGLPLLFDTWKTAKQNPSGVIVAFADSMTVLVKVHDEIVLRGNKTLAGVIKDLNFGILRSKHKRLAALFHSGNRTVMEYHVLMEQMIEEIQGVLK
jgi:5'-deoxynucleotidase YfbR-like HD superfamily hydrolase